MVRQMVPQGWMVPLGMRRSVRRAEGRGVDGAECEFEQIKGIEMVGCPGTRATIV
jgi:hypothetical protein